MSIIYEALKKIESKKSPGFNRSIYKRVSYSPQKVKRLYSNKTLLPLLLITFVFAGGLFLILNRPSSPRATAAIKFSFPPEPVQELPLPQPQQVLKDKAPPVETPAEQEKGPERVTEEKYVLEGIIYDEKESYTIINGRILGKGSRLDTFLVSNITKNSVELLNTEDENVLILDLPF